jgi:hypothetical protein
LEKLAVQESSDIKQAELTRACTCGSAPSVAL